MTHVPLNEHMVLVLLTAALGNPLRLASLLNERIRKEKYEYYIRFEYRATHFNADIYVSVVHALDIVVT